MRPGPEPTDPVSAHVAALERSLRGPTEAGALLATRPAFAAAYLVSAVVLAAFGGFAVRTLRTASAFPREAAPKAPGGTA
jgi:hypothetical protein